MPELRGMRAVVQFLRQSAAPCASPPTSPFMALLVEPRAVKAHACFRLGLRGSSPPFMHLASLPSSAPVLCSCRSLWGFLPAEDGIDSGTRLSRTGVHSALYPGSPPRPWCHARRHIGGIAIAEALQSLPQDGQKLGCHSKGLPAELAV